MKKLLIVVAALTAFIGCGKEEKEEIPFDRTVLIYMAAENNLTQWNNSSAYFAADDLKQI